MGSFGVVFLDNNGYPVDYEYDLRELFEEFIIDDYESRKYLSAKFNDFVDNWNYYLNKRKDFEYYDGVKTLSDVGLNWICSFKESIELLLLKDYIDFEGVGKDVCSRISISSGFSEFGFIIVL